MADVLSFAKVLAKGQEDLRLGRSHCAVCRGATAQRAKVFAVHDLQTRRRGIEVPAIGRGLQRRSQHPLDHETGRNKDTF